VEVAVPVDDGELVGVAGVIDGSQLEQAAVNALAEP